MLGAARFNKHPRRIKCPPIQVQNLPHDRRNHLPRAAWDFRRPSPFFFPRPTASDSPSCHRRSRPLCPATAFDHARAGFLRAAPRSLRKVGATLACQQLSSNGVTEKNSSPLLSFSGNLCIRRPLQQRGGANCRESLKTCVKRPSQSTWLVNYYPRRSCNSASPVGDSLHHLCCLHMLRRCGRPRGRLPWAPQLGCAQFFSSFASLNAPALCSLGQACSGKSRTVF